MSENEQETVETVKATEAITETAEATEAEAQAPVVEAAVVEAAVVEAAVVEAADSEAVDPDASLEASGPDDPAVMKATIIEGIQAIYDPEIPVNIWELGLIYDIRINDDKSVDIDMTLTSPMCPTAQSLVASVESAATDTPHVAEARVELVWDPPWDMDKMSEEAKLTLGF
ncbi:MAG: FeS assembly SUF system protein [Myxococcota bacterium]|jgi:FeS assembly SUF system protein